MKNLKTFLGWVALILLVLFVVLNWQYVNINIIFIARIDMPLSLVIVGSALLGAGAAVGFRYIKKSTTPK